MKKEWKAFVLGERTKGYDSNVRREVASEQIENEVRGFLVKLGHGDDLVAPVLDFAQGFLSVPAVLGLILVGTSPEAENRDKRTYAIALVEPSFRNRIPPEFFSGVSKVTGRFINDAKAQNRDQKMDIRVEVVRTSRSDITVCAQEVRSYWEAEEPHHVVSGLMPSVPSADTMSTDIEGWTGPLSVDDNDKSMGIPIVTSNDDWPEPLEP